MVQHKSWNRPSWATAQETQQIEVMFEKKKKRKTKALNSWNTLGP